MSQITRTTTGKALEINENPKIYGTFAEIGAGQEVARFFFQAGRASQTIAKTMSAYDMIYSDEIYGKEASGRYVCESRLLKMLDKEYGLLQHRLKKTRGDQTTFFAFADTVATGDSIKKYSHGWLGVRFQTHPNGEANDIVLHVRLTDKYRLIQQEALGILGTNLVHCAFTKTQNKENFISSLVENLKEGQVIIDMIRMTGPDLKHFDNHLLNLELVKRGLAEAVLFSPDQDIVTISEYIYGKPMIIARGSFRPITNSHLELMSHGVANFKTAFPKAKAPMTVFEVSMHKTQGKFDEADFLARVNSISSTGHHVLVSNFYLFFQLKQFLRHFTKEPIAMIIGANLLQHFFSEEFYQNLEGGILEGLGKLLDKTTRVFIFPQKTADTCLTTKTFFPAPAMTNIYKHFLEQKWISDMSDCEDIAEFIASDKITQMIRSGDRTWTKHVPETVIELIKKKGLFGLTKK